MLVDIGAGEKGEGLNRLWGDDGRSGSQQRTEGFYEKPPRQKGTSVTPIPAGDAMVWLVDNDSDE